MLVSEILKDIKLLKIEPSLMFIDVAAISADSRNIDGKPLFFAYKGTSFDSHGIAVDLYNAGKISGIVSERELTVPAIIVPNGRKAFAGACSNYFGRSDKKLKLIAVTGTNGKTSITWIIEKILETAGIKSVRIGTTGVNIAGRLYEINNTTPSPYEFNKYLAEGIENGAKVAISEVSSHALEQDRLAGTKFDIAIFTNLTGDHLDYHQNMDNYFNAKKRLFSDEYSALRIINISDEYGKRLQNETDGEQLCYGVDDGDLFVVSYSFDINGIIARLSYKGKEFDIKSNLAGRHNLENILAASAACLAFGLTEEQVTKGLAAAKNIPGRLEKISGKDITVFVDYAHTDDALKNVLITLKEIKKNNVITIFGAGGDRDKTKRPRMGTVAQKYSNLTVVTSDNPRTEIPEAIIEDILHGMDRNETVKVEPDRKKAITEAILNADKDDILLIAGKGHEDYQIIGNVKYPFSDVKVATDAILIREKGAADADI